MSAFRDPDAIIHGWLEEGPLVLPDPTARAIDVATRTTPQRRPAMRLPWRFPTMSMYPKVAIGAAAVVAVALGGALLLGPGLSPPEGAGGVPPVSRSPASSPSVSPTASNDLLDTTTWTPFTSPRYGISLAYPPTFSYRPSTTFWTIPEEPAGGFDYFYGGPGINNWLAASMPLPTGMTEDEWIDAYLQGMMAGDTTHPAECFARRPDWTPVTIDGHQAELRLGCGTLDALLFIDDRVYDFGAYGPDSSGLGVPEDFRELFMAWLTTITVDPASALEPPPASPTTS